MEKQFVEDLQDKQNVFSTFLVKEKNTFTGKNGRLYLSLSLSDRSGVIDARVWDNVDRVTTIFRVGDLVKIKGVVQIYNNRPQIVVHKVEKDRPEEVKMADFVEDKGLDVDQLYSQLVEVAGSVQDEHLRRLILDVVNDPEIRPKLMIAPAAKTIHHAYTGGMLEHILSICGLMNFLAEHYPFLKRDHLIFGAIFHDIGKIWELELGQDVSYSDEGRLLGHIVMAAELIEKKASQILGFPDELKTICKHIVISHHGRLEYGSPKRPKTLEAFVVAAIDDLDSKINTLSGFIDKESKSGQRWTRYHGLFDRYFLIPDEDEAKE